MQHLIRLFANILKYFDKKKSYFNPLICPLKRETLYNSLNYKAFRSWVVVPLGLEPRTP
jgi:hypothetical protein